MGSANTDAFSHQGPEDSHMHAILSEENTDWGETCKMAVHFINEKLKNANKKGFLDEVNNRIKDEEYVMNGTASKEFFDALFAIGQGLHTVMDSTSPVHMGENGGINWTGSFDQAMEHDPFPHSKESRKYLKENPNLDTIYKNKTHDRMKEAMALIYDCHTCPFTMVPVE